MHKVADSKEKWVNLLKYELAIVELCEINKSSNIYA